MCSCCSSSSGISVERTPKKVKPKYDSPVNLYFSPTSQGTLSKASSPSSASDTPESVTDTVSSSPRASPGRSLSPLPSLIPRPLPPLHLGSPTLTPRKSRNEERFETRIPSPSPLSSQYIERRRAEHARQIALAGLQLRQIFLDLREPPPESLEV